MTLTTLWPEQVSSGKGGMTYKEKACVLLIFKPFIIERIE